jgi:hypothetical protein
VEEWAEQKWEREGE